MEFGLWGDCYSKCLFPCDDIQWRHFVQATSHVQKQLLLITMQGMDINYDGHVWSKVIITNIKNSFGLSFKKACCLGHLHYVRWLWFFCSFECLQQDFLEWKIRPTFWSKGRWWWVVMFPPSYANSTISILHQQLQRLNLLHCPKTLIHFKSNNLGVHLHLVANGKCKKVVEEIKMLIEKEVNQTPDVKTLAIAFNTKKSLLVKHLFNDSSEGSFKFLKGEQL